MSEQTNTQGNAPDDADTGLLLMPQPRLHAKGLVALLALIGAIMPMSIDMYTPAVPSLPGYFNTTSSIVNVTLIGFTLFFTISMLLFGPICDKTGRKPILVGGMAAYAAGSALCALAWSIWSLIVFRVVQAIGAGAAIAVSTAVIKDSFVGAKRMRMLAALQVLGVVGPVAAPLLGGAILQVSGWHATFVVLAAFGAACLALSLLYTETLPPKERISEGVLVALTRLGVVARHKGFTVFLIVISLFSVPFMAYIAMGSYTYIDFFGLSEQAYSYFFAATSAFAVLGPIITLRLLKRFRPRTITNGLFVASAASAILMFTAGQSSPWAFCAIITLFNVADSCIRPYSVDILLSQHKADAGSTSSLINFAGNIFGVTGMALMSLPWPNMIEGLAVITAGSVAVALVFWALLLKVPAFALSKDGMQL